jgi:CYTH domain-containing protein
MEEFELTFLPKELPEGVFKSPSKEMLDIYLPAFSSHPTLRIRKSGSKHEITKKQPVKEGDASHQLETTISLTVEEFADLEKIAGKRIYKTRYVYEEKGIMYEIDVFQKDLKGLVLVDVEFKNAEDKNTFKKPDWLLVEITQETFIAGGMLAGKRYGDIEKELLDFDYKKIA